MGRLIKEKYQFDYTGNAVRNQVRDELHVLPQSGSRFIIPRAGAYYTKSMSVVYADSDVALTPGVDYHFISLDDYTSIITGMEAAAAIEFDVGVLLGDFYISYSAVGGVEGKPNTLMADLSVAIRRGEGIKVDWLNVQDRPEIYPPRLHRHSVRELNALSVVSDAVSKIDTAILDSTPLQSTTMNLRNQDERILALLSKTDNRVNQIYSYLNARVASQVTANTLGSLSKAEFPVNWSEGNAPRVLRVEGGTTVRIPITAVTELGDEHLTYTLTSGSLPNYLTLNTLGEVVGVVPTLTVDFISRLTLRVDNGFNALALPVNLEFYGAFGEITWVTETRLGLVEGEVTLPIIALTTDGSILTYRLLTGTLPSGTIMTQDGRITGQSPDITKNYAFTIQATGKNTQATKYFTLVTLATDDTIHWRYSPGEVSIDNTHDLGAFNEGVYIDIDISAVSGMLTAPINYAVINGGFPTGVSLRSDGHLTGTLGDKLTDTITDFTLTAEDGVNTITRDFKITTLADDDAPLWVTTTDLGNLSGNINIPLVAIDPEGVILTYTVIAGNLPPSVLLSNVGVLEGHITPDTTMNYNFTVSVSDGINYTNRSFTIAQSDTKILWITDAALGKILGNINLQLIASDPMGLPLTYTTDIADLPPGVNLLPTGILTGTLPPVLAGSYNFEVSVSNGITTATRIFTLLGISTEPFWLTSGLLGKLTGDVDIQLLAVDPENVPLTFSYVSGLLPQAFTLTTQGFLSGYIAPGNIVEYIFTLAISDGAYSVERTFTILGYNTVPVWVTESNLGTLTDNVHLQLLAYDPQFNPITYRVVDGNLPPNITLSTNGVLEGMLATGSTIDYNFTVAASDGRLIATRAFSILGSNMPPVWDTDTYLGRVEGVFTRQLTAHDPEGLPVTYRLIAGELPSGAILTPNGELTGVIPVEHTGNYNFTVSASDGAYTTSRDFFILDYDSPHTWVTEPDLGTLIGDIHIQFQAVDPELQSFSYVKVAGNLPPSFNLTLDGLLTGHIPEDNDQDYTFTLNAIVNGVSLTRVFTILGSNIPPVWVTDGNLGEFASTVNVQLVANDPEFYYRLRPVTYSLVGGTLPPNVVLSTTGQLTGTMVASDTEDYTFTVAASDGVNTTDRTFIITDFNSFPVWITDPQLGTFTGVLIPIQLQAMEPEGEPLTYTVVSGNLPDTVLVSASGLLHGEIPLSRTGDLIFIVRASDGEGYRDRTFTIVDVNVLPYWITGSDMGLLLGTIDTVIVAYDPELRPMQYSVTSGTLPPDLSLDVVGILSGSIPTDNTIDYSFTVEASDGVNSISREFTILGINNPPVWVTGSNLGTYRSTDSVDIRISASDPEGTVLSFTLVDADQLPPGLTYVNERISGTITDAISTPYTFRVSVSDGRHSVPRDFTINFINEAPVWVTEHTLNDLLNIVHQPLLATDPEGKSLVYTLIAGTVPAGVTLTANGLLTGVAVSTAPGTTDYTFTVAVSDGFNATSRTFTVAYNNIPPTWVTDMLLPVTGTTVNLQLVAVDDNSDTLTYTLTAGLLPVGVTLDSNGLLSGYVENLETGTTTYSFTVAVSDGFNTVVRTFSMDYSNKRPIWITEQFFLSTYQEVNYQLQASDPSNSGLQYTVIGGELPSDVVMSAGGLLTGPMPLLNSEQDYYFTVRATNSDGFTDKLLVINYPVPVPIWVTAPNLGTVSTDVGIQLVANDPSGTGNIYTITGAALPPGLTMSTSGYISGDVTITTNEGAYSVAVTASNSVGSAVRAFSLTYATPTPVWITPATNLATIGEGEATNVSVAAIDSAGSDITYSDVTVIIDGQWPAGIPYWLTLDSATGTLSDNGRAWNLSMDLVYPFTIRASNGVKSTDRDFTLTYINGVVQNPYFVTPSPLGDTSGSVSIQLEAVDPLGGTLTFIPNIVSGRLPPGLTISGTGLLSGNLTDDVATGYTFLITVLVGNRSAIRAFFLNYTG